MAININTILDWFKTGKKPTQEQFWSSWQSFWHKDETIPQSNIDGLITVLNAKTENDQFNAHKIDGDAHAALFGSKENKSDKGVAGGYVPLNEISKIASQYLTIINDLITGGSDTILSAEQGVVLQNQINAINTILSSNDVDLDTIQKIVDTIKEVETSLETILVNDLTTGGTTKALTAEMGKNLKALIDVLVVNKTNSGGFTGTSQQLKNEIDSIYQPNVLIRSVPPTRSGDTFTYPSGEYEYLINKTHYINSASFTVTIPATSTSEHKRTDLIYGKPDNTIAKLEGIESTTVAVRPEAPTGCVAISFINVFGSIASDPAPVTQEISIQDSLGSEKFKVKDYLRVKGASFNAVAKQIEIDPLVGGVIFVSNTGNNATAEPENRNRPYATLDAAILAYWNFPNIDYIEIISDTAFTITTAINNNTTRKFDLRSQKICTVNVTRNGNLSTTVGTLIQPINFYLPSGTLNFSPTTGAGFGGSGINGKPNVSIEVGTVTYGSLWNNVGANHTTYNLKAKVLNINTTFGVVTTPGGVPLATIICDTINFRGANTLLAGVFVSLDLTFKNLTHDNSFSINSSNQGVININHGSISSVSPYVNTTVVEYLKKASMNINFLTGASISSNLSILCFNTNGVLTLTGICSYPNSDILLRRHNTATGIYINQASITCKRLFGGNNVISPIYIQDSVITLMGTALGDMNQAGSGYTYSDPTISFVGTNYVFSSIDGSNLYVDESPQWTASNKPTVNIQRGVLYTNGKLNRAKLVIKENPLNQYYDTIERQKVLVDEKEEIINKTLDPTKTYVINGTITLLTGEYIEVPAGGLTLSGYGYDTSGFIKNVSGQEIFKSASGGSGNLTLKDCFFNSGTGKVFNLTDIDGSHALEFNDVNFNNCTSLGTLTGYRQFTGTTCGIYGCSNGFILKGNWSGFKFTNSNVTSFLSGGTLIKRDTDTLFSNRLYLDLNFSCNTGAILSDFGPSNFASDELFQINNTLASYGGSKDAATNTPVLLPNITPNDPKARFTNCLGIALSATKFQDLKSANGSVWRVAVDNSGNIATNNI